MTKVSAIIKETPEISLTPSPCEDPAKRQPPVNEEEGAHQTLKLPEPLPWTSQAPGW